MDRGLGAGAQRSNKEIAAFRLCVHAPGLVASLVQFKLVVPTNSLEKDALEIILIKKQIMSHLKKKKAPKIPVGIVHL